MSLIITIITLMFIATVFVSGFSYAIFTLPILALMGLILID
jgi:hypothetical protein